MRSPTAAVSRASFLCLRSHLRTILGGQAALVALGIGATLFLLGIGAVVFTFYVQNAAMLFDTDRPDADLRSARSALVQSQALSAAAIALMFLMFTPAATNLSLTARMAGASRRAILVGEFAPVAASIAVGVLSAAAAPSWFIAHIQADPWLTMFGLLLFALGITLTFMSAHFLGSLLGKALHVPEQARHTLGTVLGFAVLAAGLGDLLSSLLSRGTSGLGALTKVLWFDEVLPNSLEAVLLTLLAVLVVAAITLGLLLLDTPRPGIPTGVRLVPIPRSAIPAKLQNVVVREILLSLRHPVTQLTLIVVVVLALLIVVGTHRGYLPPGISLLALALLASTFTETAYGRSSEWGWIYAITGSSARLPFIQLLGNGVIGLVVYVSAILSLPIGSMPLPMLVSGVVTFLCLTSIAYLAGTAVPYSANAPAGMLLTSIITIALDTLVLYLASILAQLPPLPILVEIASCAAATTAACAIVRRRLARASMRQTRRQRGRGTLVSGSDDVASNQVR